jgi:hypothetical protein
MPKSTVRVVALFAVLLLSTTAFAGPRAARTDKIAPRAELTAVEGLRGDVLGLLARLARFVPVPGSRGDSFGTNGLTDTPDPTSVIGGDDGEKSDEGDKREEHEDAANEENDGGGQHALAKR